MLPLLGILDEDQNITRLNLSSAAMHDSRFRSAGNGNSNARVLSRILKRNRRIENLDLSSNGLDDDGVRQICDAMKENNTLTELNISRNHFGPLAAGYLIDAISQNGSLRKLDLSGNALGFHSINSVLNCCAPKGLLVQTSGNYVFEEILNSVSHGIAFLAAAVGSNVLVSAAVNTYKTDYHFWGCVIYSFSLLFLFLSSCLYHSFFMLPSSK